MTTSSGSRESPEGDAAESLEWLVKGLVDAFAGVGVVVEKVVVAEDAGERVDSLAEVAVDGIVIGQAERRLSAEVAPGLIGGEQVEDDPRIIAFCRRGSPAVELGEGVGDADGAAAQQARRSLLLLLLFMMMLPWC